MMRSGVTSAEIPAVPSKGGANQCKRGRRESEQQDKESHVQQGRSCPPAPDPPSSRHTDTYTQTDRHTAVAAASPPLTACCSSSDHTASAPS